MSLLTIAGAKGGGSASFKQTPDTLRSNDSFEMLLGLGEGRWKGLVNGQKSLFINDVPMESGDGSPNFTDFTATFADGDRSQNQVVGFRLGGGGATSAVGVQLTNTNHNGTPGPWVPGAVTQPGMDFVDCRFVVQNLVHQTDKGIFEATATIEIELQASDTGTWVNPLIGTPAGTYKPNGLTVAGYGDVLKLYVQQKNYNAQGNWIADSGNGRITITGKTTSSYVKELRVAVPNTGAYANKTWTVRARLIEADTYQADPVEDHRQIQFESVAGVSSKKYSWPGLVWMQLFGKASDQLSGDPTVFGIYDTMFVKAPPAGVFNPDTRVYTGAIWDGSDSLVYTNDPAWCIRDLVEDNLSGISAFSPGTTLNRWDCLECSKWFSQHVPDGKGGTHPRYTMNVSLEQSMKASDTLSYLAGAVGALTYEGGDGELRMKADKPENPVAIFTNHNIDGGEFVYGNTDVDTRFNYIIGKFQNEDLNYQDDSVHLLDPDAILAYGYRPTTIDLVGCTNRQEALRRVKLRLRVLNYETKLVHFPTNRQGMMVEPLSTILVADEDLAVGTDVIGSMGRVYLLNANRNTVTLRDPVRLEVGVNYTLTTTIPNPNYDPDRDTQPLDADWTKPTITIQRQVTNTAAQRGDVVTLFIDLALPDSLPEFAVFALDTPGLPSRPVLYRVTDVTPSDDNPEQVTISALVIDTGKWAASDNVIEAEEYAVVPPVVVPMPTPFPGQDVLTYTQTQGDFGLQSVLAAHWQRPGGLFINGFKVTYKVNDGPERELYARTQDTLAELINPASGNYVFYIRTLDRRGAQSEPLITNVVQVGQEAPSILTLTAEPQVFTFLDKVATPDAQTVLLTARRGNLAGEVHWSTGPDTPLTISGDTALMSLADFADKRRVTVRAELAGFVGVIDVVRLDKSTADAYADVTGDHTSKDTNAVGGKPSGEVLSELEQLFARLAQLDTDTENAFGPNGTLTLGLAQAEQEIADARALTESELAQVGRDIAQVELNLAQAKADTDVAVASLNVAADVADAKAVAARDEALAARDLGLDALNRVLLEAADRQSDGVNFTYQIETLSARADDNEASITQESLVRADAFRALAYRATKLDVKVANNTARLSDEMVARASADEALAGRSLILEAKVANNTASLNQEILTRSTLTDALVVQTETLTTHVADNTAAITAETTARSTADDALAERTVSLEASTSNNAAAITEEARVRTTKDDALGQRIDTVRSDFNGNLATVSQEITTLSNADTALGRRIDRVVADVGNNNATIQQEIDALTTSESALGRRIDSVVTDFNGNKVTVSQQFLALSDADTALGQRIDTVSATVDGNTTAISTEITARTNADSALGRRIDSVTTDFNGNKVTVSQQFTALSNADIALGQRIDNVAANAGGANSAVTAEATARANADTALGNRIDSVTTDFNGNKTTVSQQLTALSNADTALGQRIDNVIASSGGANAAVQQEATARTNADNALGSRIDSVSATLGANSSAITTETQARVDAFTSLSSRIDTVNSTYGPYDARITQVAQALNGQIARVAVTIDVNGYVTGWEANNNGTTGDFSIRADRFRVMNPNGTVRRFEIVNGLLTVYDENNIARVELGLFS